MKCQVLRLDKVIRFVRTTAHAPLCRCRSNSWAGSREAPCETTFSFEFALPVCGTSPINMHRVRLRLHAYIDLEGSGVSSSSSQCFFEGQTGELGRLNSTCYSLTPVRFWDYGQWSRDWGRSDVGIGANTAKIDWGKGKRLNPPTCWCCAPRATSDHLSVSAKESNPALIDTDQYKGTVDSPLSTSVPPPVRPSGDLMWSRGQISCAIDVQG